jgi:hypothetical protein
MYAKEILAIFTPIITWLLNNSLKGKAQIVYAKPHEFVFLIQEPLLNSEGAVVNSSQTVNTISHLILNTGKETATKVEITFNWRPMYLNVWPIRRYEEHTDKDGRYTLILENLSPKESMNCELLSINKSLPELVSVRSEQCLAKLINMQPQPILSNWARFLIKGVFLLGLAAAVYLSISLIQFFALPNPQ